MSIERQQPRVFYGRTQRAVLRLVADWIGRVDSPGQWVEIENVVVRRCSPPRRRGGQWEAIVTWWAAAQP